MADVQFLEKCYDNKKVFATGRGTIFDMVYHG